MEKLLEQNPKGLAPNEKDDELLSLISHEIDPNTKRVVGQAKFNIQIGNRMWVATSFYTKLFPTFYSSCYYVYEDLTLALANHKLSPQQWSELKVVKHLELRNEQAQQIELEQNAKIVLTELRDVNVSKLNSLVNKIDLEHTKLKITKNLGQLKNEIQSVDFFLLESIDSTDSEKDIVISLMLVDTQKSFISAFTFKCSKPENEAKKQQIIETWKNRFTEAASISTSKQQQISLTATTTEPNNVVVEKFGNKQ